jgi:hypothetical protein
MALADERAFALFARMMQQMRGTMRDKEARERFMVLRAQNNSYAAIERELGVTKKTLIAWGRECREEIENLEAIEYEALQEEYALTAQARVELFGEELRRVRNELATRDLSELSTPKLYDLLVKLSAQLKAEVMPPLVRSDDEVQRRLAVRELLDRISAVGDKTRGSGPKVGTGDGEVKARDLVNLQLEAYRAYVAGEIDDTTAIRRVGMLAPLLKAIDEAELQERLERIERVLGTDGV